MKRVEVVSKFWGGIDETATLNFVNPLAFWTDGSRYFCKNRISTLWGHTDKPPYENLLGVSPPAGECEGLWDPPPRGFSASWCVSGQVRTGATTGWSPAPSPASVTVPEQRSRVTAAGALDEGSTQWTWGQNILAGDWEGWGPSSHIGGLSAESQRGLASQPGLHR